MNLTFYNFKKWMKCVAYKMQVDQKLQPNYFPLQAAFATQMLDYLELNADFLKRINIFLTKLIVI